MIRDLLASGSRLWVLAFWLCVAGAAVFAFLPQPPRLATGHFADKIEHIAAFAVLALFAQLAFPQVSRLRMWLMLALFGAGIEAVQAIPALHRDSSLADWVADAAIAAVVLGIPALLRPRKVAVRR